MRQPRGIQHEYIRSAKQVDLAAVSFAIFIMGLLVLALVRIGEIGMESIASFVWGLQ